MRPSLTTRAPALAVWYDLSAVPQSYGMIPVPNQPASGGREVVGGEVIRLACRSPKPRLHTGTYVQSPPHHISDDRLCESFVVCLFFPALLTLTRFSRYVVAGCRGNNDWVVSLSVIVSLPT